MLYNNETLKDYCKTNNIILLEDYETKICREDYIEGICINQCKNIFKKTFRQMVKTGAYCTDCIKSITSNKIKTAIVKWDLNRLLNYCNTNNIILLDDYSNKFINRDSILSCLCKNKQCKNIFKNTFRELVKLDAFCSECRKEIGKRKIRETNQKNFGVDSVLKSPEIREKIKITTFERYGVEHVSKLETIKEEKKRKSLEKYNVEHVLQSPEIREKIKQTNLERYGAENPQQNIEVRNKTCNTNLKNYGYKHYSQSEDFKNKIIKTNLEKYGVHHHSQNPIVSEKMFTNAYKIKSYEMPSGKIVNYQGYENFMLDHLLLIEKVCEEDIINNRKDVPEIWFHDKNGKKRRHFVDFYIKSQNRCIEVKSIWTHKEKNFVLEKQESAKNLGYKYEIWIFDNKGNILETII